MDMGHDHRGTRGQALVEFTIVFPVQLFMTLALLQLAHLFIAKLVVNHAAYIAARAALVVPERAETDDDPGWTWNQAATREALSAAVMVCAPMTGMGAPSPTRPVVNLPGWDEEQPIIIPGWDPANGDQLARSEMSKKKTRVQVSRVANARGQAEVRADVEHDFELIFLWDANLLDFFGPGAVSANDPNALGLAPDYGTAHLTLRDFCTLPYTWSLAP